MEETGSEKPPTQTAPLSLGRLVLIVLLGALLVVRAIVPYGLRPLLLARADEALVGRIEVEDLDLSLLRGGVTLHGLEIHAEEAPSMAPPVFEAKRLWTQISWLALLDRTVDVEELEIEGFLLRLDRDATGFRLPALAPTARDHERAEDDPPPEATAAGDGTATRDWSFTASSASWIDGRIEFVDHTVAGEPEKIEVEVADLAARELAVKSDAEDDEPGRISIEAMLDRGSFALSTWIQRTDAGIDARSTLVVDDLPIDRLRAYVTGTRWSALQGALDATLDHRFEPSGAHTLKGKLALANLVVSVPDSDVPALAWKELALVVDEVDFTRRHADLTSLSSTGARLLLTPSAASPVPLLAPPRRDSAAEANEAAEADEADAEDEAAKDDDSRHADDDDDSRGDDDSRAWTWTLAQLAMRDAAIELRSAHAEPAQIPFEAEAKALSSDAEAPAPLALRATHGEGTLAFEGTLASTPLALAGRLAIADLALPPLLAHVEAPGLHWLKRGTLRAELALSLAEELTASGRLGLTALDLEELATRKLFGVEWEAAEIEIARVRAGIAEPRVPEIDLASVRLVAPRVVLARDEKGWILPPLLPVRDSETTAAPTEPVPLDVDDSVPASEPAPAAAKSTPPRLRIASLAIEGGRAKWIDRAIEPTYRGRITKLDLKAQGIAWPETRVESLALAAEGLDGATLSVSGSIDPDGSKLEGRLGALALAQFNPYLAASGYDLESGALSLESRARIRPERFRTKSRVTLESLALGADRAEQNFQENFGVPISVALGLLEDLDGRITLDIPVRGGADQVELGLAQIVGQALRKAVVGALAAPLKLLGATLRDGKVEAMAPIPIVFAIGESALAEDARPRIEELVTLLSKSPAITLELTGQISAGDDRLLCERALLAQLEAGRGVRALSELGEIGRRRNVREHLANKLAGRETKPLSRSDARWLRRQLEQAKASPASLEALAHARARHLQERLSLDHGIPAERLVLRPARVDEPASLASVAVALGEPRRPASEADDDEDDAAGSVESVNSGTRGPL